MICKNNKMCHTCMHNNSKKCTKFNTKVNWYDWCLSYKENQTK